MAIVKCQLFLVSEQPSHPCLSNFSKSSRNIRNIMEEKRLPAMKNCPFQDIHYKELKK